MLLMWVVISAGLLTIALILNNSHKACIQSMGMACPSPSIPQHAGASHLMNLRRAFT